MKKANFRGFYNQHFDRVYRYIFYRVGMNEEVAQDLTSEVFLKALKAYSKYDPGKSQAAWIHTIARNHLANHYRDTKATEDLEDHVHHLEGENGHELAENVDDLRCLCDALQELEQRERRVVELKYLEGYKYKEIGSLMGRTASAVRVEAHRAVQKLKKIYAKRRTRFEETTA